MIRGFQTEFFALRLVPEPADIEADDSRSFKKRELIVLVGECVLPGAVFQTGQLVRQDVRRSLRQIAGRQQGVQTVLMPGQDRTLFHAVLQAVRTFLVQTQERKQNINRNLLNLSKTRDNVSGICHFFFLFQVDEFYKILYIDFSLCPDFPVVKQNKTDTPRF